MLIQVAGTLPLTFVNGEGARFAVFTQGCPHRCEGCHNPNTHPFVGGTWMDTDEVLKMIGRRRRLLDGLTLSGGEPFCQSEACAILASGAHAMGLDVWCYTGFTWDKLTGPHDRELLHHVDVLVDGPFIRTLTDATLPHRGSKNQRLIDVQRSLREGRRIEYEPK